MRALPGGLCDQPQPHPELYGRMPCFEPALSSRIYDRCQRYSSHIRGPVCRAQSSRSSTKEENISARHRRGLLNCLPSVSPGDTCEKAAENGFFSTALNSFSALAPSFDG